MLPGEGAGVVVWLYWKRALARAKTQRVLSLWGFAAFRRLSPRTKYRRLHTVSNTTIQPHPAHHPGEFLPVSVGRVAPLLLLRGAMACWAGLWWGGVACADRESE